MSAMVWFDELGEDRADASRLAGVNAIAALRDQVDGPTVYRP